MGPIGMQEMIFIFVLALLLFGPKKLPELGRMLGKGLSEFRRAKNELKSTFESHMRELEREANPNPYHNSPTYSPKPYSYPYDEQGQNQSSDPYRPYDYDYSPPAETVATTSPSEHSASEVQVEQAKVETVPVADTVARTNGTQPTVAREEEHHT